MKITPRKLFNSTVICTKGKHNRKLRIENTAKFLLPETCPGAGLVPTRRLQATEQV